MMDRFCGSRNCTQVDDDRLKRSRLEALRRSLQSSSVHLRRYVLDALDLVSPGNKYSTERVHRPWISAKPKVHGHQRYTRSREDLMRSINSKRKTTAVVSLALFAAATLAAWEHPQARDQPSETFPQIVRRAAASRIEPWAQWDGGRGL